MAKRKTLRKPKSKKTRKQKIAAIIEAKLRSDGTLFPEKLKKANEFLAEAKMMDGW